MNLHGNILDILTALKAIIAATLWFKSAVIKTPVSFTIHVVKPDQDSMLGTPMDGTYAGQAYSKDLINLANALKNKVVLAPLQHRLLVVQQ